MGVDMMYHQLVEIHAIVAAQLVKCVHWCWSDSTPSLVRAGIGQQRPAVTPSAVRLAPSPPTNISPRALLWRQGRHFEPQAYHQACQGSVSTQPERSTRIPLLGKHSDFCRNTIEAGNTIEAVRRNATQHATSYEEFMLHSAQGSSEVTP
jgi:hypothetical protein